MSDCLTAADLGDLAKTPLTERQVEHVAGCVACRQAVQAALRETQAPESPFDGSLDSVPLEEPGRYVRAENADGKPVLLGAGGYARVLLARDEVIGRDVALKTLRASKLEGEKRGVTEQRLLQEARVVGQLEHPSIVPLYDLARTETGELFYAMRRIRGRTLADAIRNANTLDARLRLLPHVLAVCNAVAYAHSRGVLHRDLKPHNVMIDRFGETLVIDWGLATARGEDEELKTPESLRFVGDRSLTDVRGRLGTPAYMSPEQLVGVRALLDERSDVFGLGSILYEVLTGRAPREDGPLHEAPKKVLELAPDVPADLAALCDKALEPARAARYQTAEELARDLDAWLHGQRVTAHAYRKLELARRFVRRHLATVAVGVAALVALVVVSVASAVRVRDERNQARRFALLLAGDTLRKLPFDPRDPFRTELTTRVSEYLASSTESGDPAQAAEAWARLAVEFSSISRASDAVKAARRCLALLPDEVTDERAEATQLACRVTLIDDSQAPLDEQYAQLVKLWEGRRTKFPEDVRLLIAQGQLLLSLSSLASNRSEADAAQGWATASVELARHLTERQPAESEAWSQLGAAHYVQSINALNELKGDVAILEARAAIEAARRAHALARSPQSLLRLADMLADAYFAQTVHPGLMTAQERDAISREAEQCFAALLALDDGAPVVKRRFSEFLVLRGEERRAWELVSSVPVTDFFNQRPQLYLALIVGEAELVLRELSREPPAARTVDAFVLAALAHAVRDDAPAAVAAAREAAKLDFNSYWIGEALERWGRSQRPAIATLTAELTAAQKHNDTAHARRALEAFAASLEAK
ncbi:MAG: serine/threonine-protein kinase [Myxococcota bacterium]